MLRRAEGLIGLGRAEEALAITTDVPASSDSLYLRAECLARGGDFRRARAMFSLLVAPHLLAGSLAAQGRIAACIAAYRSPLALTCPVPDTIDSYSIKVTSRIGNSRYLQYLS